MQLNELFSRFSGYLLGLGAAAIAGVLLLGTVSYAGVAVPNGLDQLTEQAKAEGYQPPARIPSPCLPKSQVSNDQLEQIKQVTAKDPVSCFDKGNAWNGDALWGAIALVLLCVVVFAGRRLLRSTTVFQAAIFAGSIALALLVGAWLDDTFKEWLTDLDVVSTVFWRGVFAAAAVAAGALIHYRTHDCGFGARRRVRP